MCVTPIAFKTLVAMEILSLTVKGSNSIKKSKISKIVAGRRNLQRTGNLGDNGGIYFN